MEFPAETAKTKQIHAKLEPKPWFFNKTEPKTISNQKPQLFLKTEPNFHSAHP